MTISRIETERLVLRPWRHDTAAYARIVSDREVMRYMGSRARAPIRRLWAGRDISRHERHWARHGYGLWALEEKASGALIGRVGLEHHSDWVADAAQAEVCWLLARHAWGRGYATEGARAVLDDAFDRVGLERVISFARSANERSIRVMERIGLERAGTTTWRGDEVVWYALDRPTPTDRPRAARTP